MRAVVCLGSVVPFVLCSPAIFRFAHKIRSKQTSPRHCVPERLDSDSDSGPGSEESRKQTQGRTHTPKTSNERQPASRSAALLSSSLGLRQDHAGCGKLFFVSFSRICSL